MRRERTVRKRLDVDGTTIQDLFFMYEEKELVVNRRYQRKLVWDLEEKKSFIDTLMRKYPIPIIIFANFIYKETNEEVYEIIDGLQRLDAVFSFITCKFPIHFDNCEGYFNLDAISGYGAEIRAGNLIQPEPVLPLDLCLDFLRYKVPCSVTGQSDDDIDEIFRRINSKGRKLANQELRQAGITGNFSDIVRKVSSYVRGDYTASDSILINNLSKYSLNTKKLDYGIKIDEVFWLKQGIINETQLRNSKDEEIIANLCIYLMTGGKYSPSSNTLDKAYRPESSLKNELDNVCSKDPEYWINTITRIMKDLECIFTKNKFSSVLFSREKVYNKDCAFIVLACAIANLYMTDMKINNKTLFLEHMKNLGETDLQELVSYANAKWNKKIRDRLVKRIENIIKDCFVSNNDPDTKEFWEASMINLIENAESESSMYDFKAGITNFDTETFNPKTVSKVVKSLTAMANTHPRETGTIVFGIPDTNKSAKHIENVLNVKSVKCKSYNIIGIREEALKYYGSVDKYRRKIKEIIDNEPIPDYFKNDILSRIKHINYRGKLLLIITCSSNLPVYYDGKMYIRRDSNDYEVEIGSEEHSKINEKFYRSE